MKYDKKLANQYRFHHGIISGWKKVKLTGFYIKTFAGRMYQFLYNDGDVGLLFLSQLPKKIRKENI